MKLIDTPNNQFEDQDPKTLTPGTPIPASTMNALQDEIANVITGYGFTIDSSNNSQMKEALESHYAPLVSAGLSGIPTTSNPDGTVKNQIATVDYVDQKALSSTVGFTPVQQNGGTGQSSNKLYMGWATDGSGVTVQVDSTSMGPIVFQEIDSSTAGVSKIGYNTSLGQMCFYETKNKAWHFLYSVADINAKSFIPSTVTGNNEQITNIIWNESSNLPAYYYGPNNSVSYSATTDWVSNGFAALNGNPTFNTAYITTAPSVSDSGNLVPNTWWVNAQGYAKTSWVTANYITGTYANSTYVSGVASGSNVSISNIQAVNYSGSDNSSAYIQVATPDGAIALPTASNISSQLTSYAQPKGSYVDAGTYSTDFNSADSRILFSAYGKMIQFENVGAVASGTRINFPRSFSDTPIVTAVPTTAVDQNSHAYSVDSTGFYIYRNAGGTIQFNYIAIGNR
ncbi:hypothetical protein [Gluconobacter frateurii]|uniref:Tail fiber protein n=1 Tax=Gluconobacter frateurii NRIC 0228 TaxID=1307946 RepID=A0ABQ0QDB7_9PROT|nr:hypothetical protein [Gluconobacter frateurii]GBR14149.1 hypothetical protein AA0228_2187 [Gluconobacter frateurii NRIC 0228]GLP92017.1 hypothetical protein GCM10007868_30920 [Gluconobacter frateurii]